MRLRGARTLRAIDRVVVEAVATQVLADLAALPVRDHRVDDPSVEPGSVLDGVRIMSGTLGRSGMTGRWEPGTELTIVRADPTVGLRIVGTTSSPEFPPGFRSTTWDVDVDLAAWWPAVEHRRRGHRAPAGFRARQRRFEVVVELEPELTGEDWTVLCTVHAHGRGLLRPIVWMASTAFGGRVQRSFERALDRTAGDWNALVEEHAGDDAVRLAQRVLDELRTAPPEPGG